MKIAVVGSSPVPFMIGGAENLLWGLCETINRYTKHDAELIKLPVREHDFWNLIESYFAYYTLDLSHFDLVITSKYPSWMVCHKNSICYMVHTLRGLYDTYHLMGQPSKVKRGNAEIDKILDYMDKNKECDTLDIFFSMLFELKKTRSNVPKEYFTFPGPFIRVLVHFMDQFALSQKGVKKICAISKNVMGRKDYFPKGSNVAVYYPPSALKDATCGGYNYIFMISRLDAPKRIDMLIRSMSYVKSNIKLLIAGTGPQENTLKQLAKGDDRIQFLGFVNDDLVDEYYANSLVVPYFPYDEDYGLITIEAMLHRKPVITTVDAGGPNEFVIDNETGFITKFNDREIAEKIDYFAMNPKEAVRMGNNAYNMVKSITWEKLVDNLLDEHNEKRMTSIKTNGIQSEHKKKITVTSTFPIFPPTGGGQARIYNLYQNLTDQYSVEIVSFTSTDQKAYEGEVAKGLKEIRVQKSSVHQEREWEIEKRAGIPISDIAMLTLSSLTPEYGDRLKESIEASEWVVISHPYLYQEAKKYLKNKKFIYEAHNVESILKANMLPDSKVKKGLLKQVFDTEKDCCEKSEFIMTCSIEDQQTIHDLYNVPFEKMIVVPNGVDCQATKFTDLESRIQNKLSNGLEREKIGLFMGSWHKPNLEACEEIFKLARKNQDVKYMVMGSQCLYFEKHRLPKNIGMLGLVSEEQKNRIFSLVDFALNPIMSGSGTNLKMFDYMSAGIPIITTEFGTRGIDKKNIFINSEINNMHHAISAFRLEEESDRIKRSRAYVEEHFDWKVIVKILKERLHK